MQVVQSPAEYVASQVQAVLSDHGSQEAWQALAEALPQFAIREGADMEATLEAARIATQMGSDAALSKWPANPGALEEWMWTAMSMADEVIPWIVGAVALLVLWSVARGSVSGARVRSSVQKARPALVSGNPWQQAHALAAHGLPVHEISHRTGMSREAVATLLRIRR